MIRALTKSKKNKKITIIDVAADAGVSVSAVSKVMRNAYGVSDALRKKVENSIQALGYRPRAAARGMRGKTFTIGVLISSLRNPFLPDLISGIREVADNKNYRLMITVGRDQSSIEADLLESMIDHQMDGLILISPSLPPETIAKYTKEIPIACIAYHKEDSQEFDTINVDDFKGAQIAVQHLIDQGLKKIAMFSLQKMQAFETSVQRQRELGYEAIMETSGLSEYINIYNQDLKRDKDIAKVRELLHSADRPDAIFCWSDLDALLLLSIAYEENIKIPEDISIVGFDNSSVAELPQISLSSINQHGEDLGRMSAEILFERMNGREVTKHELIEPQIAIRNSSKN